MAYKRDLKTPMRKSVMVLLADKASDDGTGIYASKQTMADELCCSKQAVLDAIKGFIAEELLIEIGQRRNANGFTIEYGINIAALEAVPLVSCHANRQSTRLTGQSDRPVKEDDGTSQPAGPKPSKNHTSGDKSPSVVHAKPSTRKSRLPEGWEPKPLTPGSIAADTVSLWPPGQWERELSRFRDHHTGRGNTMADWDAAWRTWIGNDGKFGNRGSYRQPTGSGRTIDAANRAIACLERRGVP